MIVEMRTYQTKAGARDRFLQVFHELTLPEHERLGMKMAGPFLTVDDRTASSSCAASQTWRRGRSSGVFYDGPPALIEDDS
jgi:hypothetical protein